MVQSPSRPVTLAHDPLYHRGIALYHAGRFFECHEVLEELWTPMRGPQRLYLQALIHFAVAFYHQQRGNPAGAERQLKKALRKIAGYRPLYEGVDTGTLYDEGTVCLEKIVAGETPGPPRMLVQGLVNGGPGHRRE